MLTQDEKRCLWFLLGAFACWLVAGAIAMNRVTGWTLVNGLISYRFLYMALEPSRRKIVQRPSK